MEQGVTTPKRCHRGSRVTIQGIVSHMSHVLYTKGSKCFFLKVLPNESLSRGLDQENEDHQAVILFPIHYEHLRFVQTGECPIGLSVTCTNLKLHEWDKYKGLTFKVSSKTEVNIKPSSTQERPPTVTVFSGIVTDDRESASGIFMLEKKIKVVSTGICHVTNITRMRKGERIMICNPHLLQTNSKEPLLVMCSKSYLKVVDKANRTLHNKIVTEEFGRNIIVDLALREDLNYKGILIALEVKRKLVMLFSELIEGFESHLLSCENNTFVKIIKILYPKLFWKPSSTRSLISEFCSTSDECHLSRERLDLNNYSSVQSLEDITKEARNELNSAKCLKLSLLNQRFSMEVDSVDFEGTKKLLGFLEFCKDTGDLLLKDSSCSVRILIRESEERSEAQKFKNCLIIIHKYVVVLEWLKGANSEQEHFYLILNAEDIEVLLQKDDSTTSDILSANPTDDKWIILKSSSVLKRRDFQSFILTQAVHSLTNKKRFLLFNFADIKYEARFLPFMTEIQTCNRLTLVQPSILPNQERSAADIELDEIISRPNAVLSVKVPREPKVHYMDLDDWNNVEADELVSLCGIVRERWLESKRLGGWTLHIKLTGSGKSPLQKFEKTSCYLSSIYGCRFPLGVQIGSRVLLENVKKKRSQKGFPYLVGSIWTHVRILSSKSKLSGTEASVRGYLCHLVPTDTTKYLFTFTLESIVKISIVAICTNCSSEIRHGICRFSGCHSKSHTPQIRCKANLMVDDGTKQGILFIDEINHLKIALNMTHNELKALLSSVINGKEEFLYIKNCKNKEETSGTYDLRTLFLTFFETLPSVTVIRFSCIAKQIRSENPDYLKLYCKKILEGNS